MAHKTKETWTPAEEAKKMHSIGESLATEYNQIEVLAGTSKKTLLLNCARLHAGNKEGIKALLDGYQAKFIELGCTEGVAKTRKAECNTVFKCVAANEVSNHNLKLLEDFNGGYHAFISYARELIAESETAPKGGRAIRPPKVTPTQESFIQDKMQSATILQLSDFVATASEILNQPKEPEKALLAEKQQLILIDQIAHNMIKNTQYSTYGKATAQKLIEITKKAIKRMENTDESPVSMEEMGIYEQHEVAQQKTA